MTSIKPKDVVKKYWFGCRIIKETDDGTTESIKVFGIPVKKENNEPDMKKVSYFGGLFGYRKTSSCKKNYVLGIPFYTKKTDIYIKRYFLGILFSKESNIDYLMEKIKSDIKNIVLEDLFLFSHYREKVASCHKKYLLPYKNLYEGKSIVICGSGPSVNFYTQKKDAVHIGLNRIYEKEDLHFDYLFFWDLMRLKEADPLFFDKISKYPAKKIIGQFMSEKISKLTPEYMAALDAIPVYSSALHMICDGKDHFVDQNIYFDISSFPLMDFDSVAFGAFHFALYTGAKKIYLVGIDNSLNGYFKKEHTQEFLCTDSILDGWQKAKSFIEEFYPDVEIISVNPVGLKGIFHDVYTKEYLTEHPEIQNAEILDI